MAKAISTLTTQRSAPGIAKPSDPLRRARLTRSAARALATRTAIPVGAAPANSDAELIGLCAELDTLERRIHALFDSKLSDLSFEAADAAAAVTEVDQHRVLARIRTLTPTTDEGCQAVAQSLALLGPSYAACFASELATVEEQLASVLVRGMMGRTGLS